MASSEVEGSEVGAKVQFSEVVEEARVEFTGASGVDCSQRVGVEQSLRPYPRRAHDLFQLLPVPALCLQKSAFLKNDDTFSRSLDSKSSWSIC